MVEKLVSLECAVLAGMWYTRLQCAAMSLTGLKSETKKRVKNSTPVFVSPKVRGMVYLGIFLTEKEGVPLEEAF